MDGSDASLVARARTGDEDAFRELVIRHSRNVFRLSYRLTGNEEDAEDVVQESFLKAYRSLSGFQGNAEFTSWLYRITTNCALDLVRRRQRHTAGHRPIGVEEGETDPPSAGPSPERLAAGAELSTRLKAAMARLSVSERAAFVLRHFEGRPLTEIAEALGIRTGAAKNAIFRAVTKLRSELGAHVVPR